ncbi:MAG TPA: ABC transporter permease [Pyrinomonadaceae bacterium]|nr:ABC transporter permease [Pyrinomonadaceae bacterium]
MNFELKLAWKYSGARRKSLARFTAMVAVVGIASGVAALILAQALARGFADEMRDKILSNTAHIIIYRADGEGMSEIPDVEVKIKRIENVASTASTTYESALLIGKKTDAYCVLRGKTDFIGSRIPQFETYTLSPGGELVKVQEADRDLTFEPPIVGIGAELAEKTGLLVGDEAEITLAHGVFAPYASRRVVVKEIFRTGLYDYDSTWVYVSFVDLARISGNPAFLPTVLSVSAKDIYATGETADEIRRTLGDEYKVLDWQEANRPLFAALGLERKVSLAIISLIIFIAVLNITTTLALLVNERRLDIAVLRTCGAQARSLIAIFLLEGSFLGIAGIVSGLILGLALCLAANYFKIISLPADVYSLSYIPLQPQVWDILLIASIAFALSLAATVYPAFRAARIKPLENLRNQ